MIGTFISKNRLLLFNKYSTTELFTIRKISDFSTSLPRLLCAFSLDIHVSMKGWSGFITIASLLKEPKCDKMVFGHVSI